MLAYEASQQLWLQLLQSAPLIEISYAKQRDERELLPSPFVAGMEPQHGYLQDIGIVQQLPLEDYDDTPDVPLGTHEAVRGGSSIIKNQSDCPFRAFAMHRLGISRLEETTPGIDPKRKGSLVHRALEQIWKRLGSRQSLAAHDDNERTKLVEEAIASAWQQCSIPIGRRTREYEKKRMRRLLLEWLELELHRPDFRVIDIEREYLMHLPAGAKSQFPVRIKVDRMDEDGSGRRILIDYKTGARQPASRWLRERIEEPQLPQYALAAGLGADDAVAFARVRNGDMAYEGLCGRDIGISGIVVCDGRRGAPGEWLQVLEEWRVNVDALAEEFVNGCCRVSPRNAEACRYCGLEAVCRIGEIGFGTVDVQKGEE